jgi:nucleotide-binding universal stress UspA family protein
MRVEPLGPVVVEVDGSAESMSALDLAAEEAASRVIPLVVVHVRDPRAAGRPDQPAAAMRLLAAAVSRSAAEHPALSVTAELLSGEAGDTLVDRSRQASLLVVAHRPHCGERAAGGRSVAHQVVARSAVPVIVRRSLYPSAAVLQPRPVLVGVACAPGDDAVLEFAFAEASRRGAPLRAVHIWPGSAYAESQQTWHGFVAARDEADRMLVDALRAWSEKYPEVTVHRVVRHGLDVPVSLAAASRSAQLVIVGARRQGDPVRQLLSVSQSLAHRAGCSVAVVPAS